MFAAAGYGIGIGLELQMALYHYPGVIVRPVADVPTPATFIVTSKRPPSEALSHFVACVRQIECGMRLH